MYDPDNFQNPWIHSCTIRSEIMWQHEIGLEEERESLNKNIMKTPEEIVKENFGYLPIEDKNVRDFYKKVIVVCLEEYGTEAYNQAVDDVTKNIKDDRLYGTDCFSLNEKSLEKLKNKEL